MTITTEFKLLIEQRAEMALYYTGKQGDISIKFPTDTAIPINKITELAQLIDTSIRHENWGWVYLGISPNRSDFQLYVYQPDNWGTPKQEIGYFSPRSTKENPNPHPFPDGVATFKEDYFVLMRRPPMD